MNNYHLANVNRLVDKKSQSHPKYIDRIRSFLLRRTLNLNCGPQTLFKKGVTISVSDRGVLKIGNHCLFHKNVLLLLTLPTPSVAIGNSVFVGQDTIIAAKNSIIIGDFTVFAPRCYVIDHEHGFESDDLILNQKSVLKKVNIGRDCYFGTGSVVLGGVSVGDGAIIGAGSIVIKNIPAGEVWAGNPAKFIKKR